MRQTVPVFTNRFSNDRRVQHIFVKGTVKPKRCVMLITRVIQHDYGQSFPNVNIQKYRDIPHLRGISCVYE